MTELLSTLNITFVKVPFSGASYKEVNNIVEVALSRNPELKTIIRGIDMNKFFDDKDKMRSDLGEFPTYLYDEELFNDLQYIFNRDVVFSRIYSMIKEARKPDFVAGITSFDQYGNWMKKFTFGKNTVFPDGVSIQKKKKSVHLSEQESDAIRKNIEQNVTSIAQKYPAVSFYYFITPYSIKWWMEKVEDGTLNKQIEAERIVVEEILKQDNIKLFSFNCMFNITTDLNNYKDSTHYGEWINSLMLRYMHDDRNMLTKGNYNNYCNEELSFYSTFDYLKLNDQEDYDDDYYAAFNLAKDAYGIEGKEIKLATNETELKNSVLDDDQYEGSNGVVCSGSLQRDSKDKNIPLSEYLRNSNYIGLKIKIKDITPIKFISFYGRKIRNHGQPVVYIYNVEGNAVAEYKKSYKKISKEWELHVINVSDLNGEVDIIFNGGYTDRTGSKESEYVFSDIKLY